MTEARTTSTEATKLNRRSDNTILPLSNRELHEYFGEIKFTDNKDGSVNITNGWTRHLEKFEHALLIQFAKRELLVHRLALNSFKAVFDDIEKAGPAFSSLLLTCEGTFVPRHKGWDVRRDLSSHSWGIAIDLNGVWNGYGANPALPGQRGSLQELVPIFNAHGFAWGGHFSPPYKDGMHFEFAGLPGSVTASTDELISIEEKI